MEYLDLVNENDEVIGKEDREIIYQKNMKNFRVINIIVVANDGKIVLPKRSNNRKLFPNCYDFSVGGHVSSGETYEEAAYRELEEELGISNVELEEIGYFRPEELGTSSFSKLYRLMYDGNFEYDKDGIAEIFYKTSDEIEKLLEEDVTMFKGDYPKIFRWMRAYF